MPARKRQRTSSRVGSTTGSVEIVSISGSSQAENISSQVSKKKNNNNNSSLTKTPTQNDSKSPKSQNSKSPIQSSKTAQNKTKSSSSSLPPPPSINTTKTIIKSTTEDHNTSGEISGANIGHEFQAMIPKAIKNYKFHSDRKFDNCFETCLWKPPLQPDIGIRKKFIKDLDLFLKDYKNINRKALNESQILGILMVNNYNMESAKRDLKHYESTLNEEGMFSGEIVKKIREGITKWGSDLYKISREYNIPMGKLVQYYHVNYNGGNEQTKSLKELEFVFDKKAEKEKKKLEKTAITTRSKNNSKDGNDYNQDERQKNIVQSVLNSQGVDDRTRYDMANYEVGGKEIDEDDKGDDGGRKRLYVKK